MEEAVIRLAGFPVLIIGILSCFFGYRLVRVVLILTGFLIGGVLAAGFSSAFLGMDQLYVLLLGLVGGLIGAGLLSLAYIAGVFIAGALLGVAGGVLFGPEFGIDPLLAAFLLGVTAGILALFTQRLLIIAATSVFGAWLAAAGLALIVDRTNPEQLLEAPLEILELHRGPTWLSIAGLAFLLLGLAKQLKTPPKKERKKRRGEDD